MRQIRIGDWKANKKTIKLVNQVLTSGRISYGPMCKKFESKFSRLHNCSHGILSNSGTSSLEVAIQTLKELNSWQDGDEVICPATTFVATINAILYNNLKPILVDVDTKTYNIAVSKIHRAITERTRLIIPVHLFGQSANMTAINEIADKYNLNVIEDACEAAFASHNGQPVGSLSDIGVFSFYMSHHLNAGVGGMAITCNDDYAKYMRRLVNHGWDRKDGNQYTFDFEEAKRRYYFTNIGHSYRITEFEAAIALSQIDDYGWIVGRRQENALALTEGLVNINKVQLPYTLRENSHSWMMYPITLLIGNKWELVEYLEKNGIETRECLPLVSQPCYNELWEPKDYPVSRFIEDNSFYIGCHQYLGDDDIGYVIEKFKEYFK